ncbi:Mov34/MPN/PAD-1 family protein [Myxococcus sp. MxC21-1]|uniref:Mov34/MPN/PAD-1 family protein n=1 Tax=Myxococcus sp. MxC21-1 TaxID=3041439 RepID=UPI00292CBD5A|nr:Mov34/MPN/PAD-1 family protein [Myxococcus sp. MxC21-1]WNZ59918.1 Mov34/MPN/PAD-1 family protein [Myxococcus sp. MxC21-1]
MPGACAKPAERTATLYVADGYRAWLSQSAVAKAARLACAAAPLETGGMLLGQVVDGEAHVLAVTGPGPKAKHGRYTFEGDGAHNNRLVRRVWPRLRYLGDWHTHPGGHAALSATDLASVRESLTPAMPAVLELLLAGPPGMASFEAALFTVVCGEDAPLRMTGGGQ